MIQRRFDRASFGITLGALFLIPLVFNYFQVVSFHDELRVSLLHLAAGFISIFWFWNFAIGVHGSRRKHGSFRVSSDLLSWASSNPARWAMIAVGVFAIVQIASTLLSPLPVVSFFGRSDSLSGYGLYDSMSMIVILASVAINFKTVRRIELLALVLVVSGTVAAIYGSAQHFGWDPIGEKASLVRAVASFGNTLNFGAYLVMAIPATLALILLSAKRGYAWTVGITGALAFQFAALWFSGGRGPFVGVVGGLFIFAVIAILLISRRDQLRIIVTVAVAALVAMLVVSLPSPQGDIGLQRVLSITGQLSGGTNATASTDIAGGLEGRYSIWRSTLKLATRWDVPVEDSAVPRILRPVFGVGPDMYVYSFPFVGEPQSRLARVAHAHNLPLHVLIELGYLGLLTLAAVSALLVVATIASIRKIRSLSVEVNGYTFAILAVIPALAGKFAEVQTGVSRVSDLAMMFALVGAVVVIHELTRAASAESASEDDLPPTGSKNFSSPLLGGSFLLVALVMTILIASLFVSWDVRRISASQQFAANFDHPDVITRTKVWRDTQARAPERISLASNLFDEYVSIAVDQKAQGNDENAFGMMLAARDIFLEYEKRDPFEWQAQVGLAKAATKLTEWGYSEYAQDMADRYINIVKLYPTFPSLIGTAATVMSSVGLHDLAIEYANQAIATEDSTRAWPKAWYAKGRSLFETGQEEEAIESLLTAIEKDPDSDGAILAHQILGEIYALRGERKKAEEHDRLGRKQLFDS